ncbi:exonuclease GOR-like [Cavia porcellus]|uniref:exonuclease GOR-like n=1 Tax=Cavia porcellus TaxID=10141 RepID=UPI002FE14830
MSLRATAPPWFPPGHPQSQKVEAVGLISYPSPPQTCYPAPGFILIHAQPPRRGLELPPARPRIAQGPQQTPASCWESGSPKSARKPFSVHSPGGKRKINVPGAKLAVPPTDAKRTLAASASRASNGAQPGGRPLKTRSSPGMASGGTSADTAAKHASYGRSLQKFQKDFGGKTPTAVRQCYFGLFADEYLAFCLSPVKALKRVWIQDKMVYHRSPGRNRSAYYPQGAVRAPKVLRGLLPSFLLGLNRVSLYSRLCRYLLTEEQRKANSYPFPDPERPGRALLFTGVDKPQKSCRRTCCRCGAEYLVTAWGLCMHPEQCYYHWGRLRPKLEAGSWENKYTCCSAPVGSIGCQVAKQHVHDGKKEDLEGFVKTMAKGPSQDAYPGIYALDCEMCFTSRGLELTRVTVVDAGLRVVYDTFVKPYREIVDYNTRFSGVTEADLAHTSVRLRDVQAFLLGLLSADTILIGHSLESDLLALKVIHHSVVDTSVLFPHPRGLPCKPSLRSLVADYLQEVIQDKPAGHNSREDASSCMRLVGWKIMEDAAQSSWNPGSWPPPQLVSPATQACVWPRSPNTASSKPALCTASPATGN